MWKDYVSDPEMLRKHLSQNTSDLKMQVFFLFNSENKLCCIHDMIVIEGWENWIEIIKTSTQTESSDITTSNYMFLETGSFLL